jgi:hypothetical protein
MPEPSPPLPSPPPASRLPGNLAIVLIVIVILAFIAGLIIASNLSQGQTVPGADATPVKTTPVTTPATPKPTTVRTTSALPATTPTGSTQVMVPSSGVWVRVMYPGTYTGLIGTPGNQNEVTDTGDHVYSISTGDGIVAVSLQKKDGSADKIVVEVYKNGVLVRIGSTTTPKGVVEIQFDLKSLQSSGVNATQTG